MIPKKRIFDLGFTLAALPVWGPVILIGALLVKVFSEGNIFYVQKRIGRNGRPFQVIKFRTMIPNAERMGAGIYNEENDSRFTRIGILLRRSSIDEVPQFINVLRGEMSVVGPRPMLRVIVDQYRDAYDQILTVNPGLTGLAQIRGRNELPRSKRLAIDIEYAHTWNIFMDLKIMLQTIRIVLSAEGQRNDQSRSEVER